MEERYIFKQNGKKAYLPQMYGLKNNTENIFSVPGMNRVGTLQYDNGLTLIGMSDDHLDYKVVAKDYDDEVYGDFVYSHSPVYSEDEILYCQDYDVHKININTGKVTSYDLYKTITKEIGIYIHRIQPIGRPDIFLCEFQEYNYNKEIKEGKLMQFADSAKVFGSLQLGFKYTAYDQPWQYTNGTVFTYDSAANKIVCHNTESSPVTHPFAEIFNRNSKDFRKLEEFLIHPNLPFGIVVEIGKDIDLNKIKDVPVSETRTVLLDSLDAQSRIHALYLLRWDTQDTNKQFVPIFTEPVSVIPGLHPKTYSDFQWSPDGKWLVFRDETQYTEWEEGTPTAEENPVFVALPVNEQNPLLFGEPLYLGKVVRENATPTSSAWVQKPVSFVVSDGLVLYKWDLDNVSSAMNVSSPNDVVPVK
jgi:hypothetical protein